MNSQKNCQLFASKYLLFKKKTELVVFSLVIVMYIIYVMCCLESQLGLN